MWTLKCWTENMMSFSFNNFCSEIAAWQKYKNINTFNLLKLFFSLIYPKEYLQVKLSEGQKENFLHDIKSNTFYLCF